MPDGSAATSASELAILFPAPRTVTISGRAVQIEACTLRQSGRVLDLGLPLWMSLDDGDDPYALLEDKPAETNALIVAATGLDAEWVGSLSAVDRAELVTAWLEVNGAFFVQRLVPLRVRAGKALRAMSGAGPTSSAA